MVTLRLLFKALEELQTDGFSYLSIKNIVKVMCLTPLDEHLPTTHLPKLGSYGVSTLLGLTFI